MAKSDTPMRDAVLVKYLNEAYGKEKQLETALSAQIALASRPQLKSGLKDHLKVTKAQSAGLKKRIRELGGKAEPGPDLPGPDVVSGAATAVANVANRALAGAKGPMQALRGTSEADNELRNVRDCFWNEAEEIAHYDVIEALANQLGDKETAKLARAYRRDEEKMQALLKRQIPQLIKAVVREEVPAAERRSSSRSSSRRSGSRSTGATRSSRSAAAQKAAATRSRKAAKTSAKRTASSAATTAKKSARAARSSAKRVG